MNPDRVGQTRFRPREDEEPLGSAFFWLCAFWFVYCARPEDWIPGLRYIPLAKITGLVTLVGLLMSAGKTKRSLRDLPIEGRYLIALIGLLVSTSFISPVWKTGALLRSLDFAKGGVAWILTFLLVTNFRRLKRLIVIQAASVGMVAIVSVLKGSRTPRLEGVLNGMYFNANDLAFALVLALPFCVALLLQTRNLLAKLWWIVVLLFIGVALMLTASRAGFICLVISGSVMLWHFGVRGKRPLLIAGTFLVLLVLALSVGGKLKNRFAALSGDSSDEQSAYGSYVNRKELMIGALKTIVHYPVYGIGVDNFISYGGYWREVHNSFLQIGAEGGIPALVLYILFLARGFTNLRKLRKRRDLDPNVVLFVGALHSSLVGFVVGANFGPEAYQLFSYIAVAQTSVIWAIVQEQNPEMPASRSAGKLSRFERIPGANRLGSRSRPNLVES
jgi:O-antigen ligase